MKHVQGLYDDKYKMLMKEINKDLNKWEDILCSLAGRFNREKNVNSPQWVEYLIWIYI